MDKDTIIKALRDGAQSTSNGIAHSAVGDNVDGLAWLLRKAGVPVGDMPMGGTDWLRAKGLTAPVEDGLPQAIGEGLGKSAGNMVLMPSQLKGIVQQAVK